MRFCFHNVHCVHNADAYQKLELEKRKKKTAAKVVIKGPMVRYHSVIMPGDMRIPANEEGEDVEAAADQQQQQQQQNNEEASGGGGGGGGDALVSHDRDANATTKRQSRTFITFTDESTWRHLFPSNSKPRVVQRDKCVVTGLPAKYIDPLTKCPYANVHAFKALREMHALKQQEASVNTSKNS